MHHGSASEGVLLSFCICIHVCVHVSCVTCMYNACYSRSIVSTTARNLQKETFVLPVGLYLCESLHAQVTSQEDNAPESDFV